jgi:hypothetical protein
LIGTINILEHVATTANFEPFDVQAPPVVPAISTLVRAQLLSGSTASTGVAVAPDNGAGTGPAIGYGAGYAQPFLPSFTFAGAEQLPSAGVLPVNPGAPKFWVATGAGAGTNAMLIVGFEHKVRRLHY